MDGRGIVAAFALGAQGVSLGTASWAVRRAALPTATRRRSGYAGEATVVTDVVTGRPARWIHNRLVDALLEAESEPSGGTARARSSPTAARGGRAGPRGHPADARRARAPLSREREPAAEIVARLVRETDAVLAELAALA